MEPIDDNGRETIDEDDHDLLTFVEAGERLRIEVARAAQEVERQRESGSTDLLELQFRMDPRRRRLGREGPEAFAGLRSEQARLMPIRSNRPR
jgi:hypothetical protein